MKSGNLNFLEPSGSLQACNGTAFYNRDTAHVECKNEGDTSNNRGDWDYLKVI